MKAVKAVFLSFSLALSAIVFSFNLARGRINTNQKHRQLRRLFSASGERRLLYNYYLMKVRTDASVTAEGKGLVCLKNTRAIDCLVIQTIAPRVSSVSLSK